MFEQHVSPGGQSERSGKSGFAADMANGMRYLYLAHCLDGRPYNPVIAEILLALLGPLPSTVPFIGTWPVLKVFLNAHWCTMLSQSRRSRF
jgi:hypothetical protein